MFGVEVELCWCWKFQLKTHPCLLRLFNWLYIYVKEFCSIKNICYKTVCYCLLHQGKHSLCYCTIITIRCLTFYYNVIECELQTKYILWFYIFVSVNKFRRIPFYQIHYYNWPVYIIITITHFNSYWMFEICTPTYLGLHIPARP